MKMQAKQFLPIFPLIFLLLNLQNVSASKKDCRKVTFPNSKHKWNIDQFIGFYNGIELYAFNDEATSFNDTCTKIKITEVNEEGLEVMKSNSSDLYNSPLALRHLKLNFYFNALEVSSYQVTLNMSNVGYWNNNDVTVQVLRVDESQLLLAICENDKFYAILLENEAKVKDDRLRVSSEINMSLLKVKNLTTLKRSKLDAECTEIPENIIGNHHHHHHHTHNDNSQDDQVSSSGKLNFSFTTFTVVVLISKFLI